MRQLLYVVLGFASVTSAVACDASLTDGNSGGADGSTSGSGGSGFGQGLPCDVVDVLSACAGCHATAKPSGGVSLASYDDLVAPSPDDPSVTVADRALARMKDAAAPMPPTGQLDAASIATFEAWIQNGKPQGDCADITDPTGSVCTSNQTWFGEDGPDMEPGRPCVSCHQKPNAEGETGPGLLFGGTVYPTVHEPDGCIGGGATVAGAVVVVTDANGVEHTATVRPGGNFLILSEAVLAKPIHAEVRRDGKVNKMKDPVDSGDCNSCHTENGANGAPGRILAP